MLLGEIIFGILVICWLFGLTFWIVKVDSHYKKLVSRTGKTDIAGILERIISGQSDFGQNLKEIERNLAYLSKKTQGHIQKIASVRFNPYSDTGGDQSFAIALLDGLNTGVIILSLHGRDGTRMYVKQIANGKSRHTLSQEEKQALEDAIKFRK